MLRIWWHRAMELALPAEGTGTVSGGSARGDEVSGGIPKQGIGPGLCKIGMGGKFLRHRLQNFLAFGHDAFHQGLRGAATLAGGHQRIKTQQYVWRNGIGGTQGGHKSLGWCSSTTAHSVLRYLGIAIEREESSGRSANPVFRAFSYILSRY